MRIGRVVFSFAAFCAVVWSENALAQTQVITPAPINQSAPAGGGNPVAIDVNYTTTPTATNTTGIGFRLFFNASQLTFVSLTNVRAQDLTAQDVVPQPDLTDADGDPATTHYLGIAYTSLTGTFPNATQPTRLYTANFTTTPAFVSSTSINFRATSTAAGFTFASTPATITAGAPLAAVPTLSWVGMLLLAMGLAAVALVTRTIT